MPGGYTPTAPPSPSGHSLRPFGPGQAWLAVRGDDPRAVAEALGLVEGDEVPAGVAMDLAHGGAAPGTVAVVAARPRSTDWVLVVAWAPPFDALTGLDVVALAHRLDTDVCLFSAAVHGPRVAARVVGGELVDLAEADGSGAGEPSVSVVLRRAASWSLDPTRLAGPAATPALVGHLPG